MRILLVEDEPSAAHVLAKGLREQSYAVDGLTIAKWIAEAHGGSF